MKLHDYILSVFFYCFFTSFAPSQACEYAGSNISYVKSEAEKALATKDLQLARFHIYKALGAISKSKEKLKDCGCEHATDRITEVSEILKNATKTTAMAGTRILLDRAIKGTSESLEALHDHDQHTSPFGTDSLKLNTGTVKAKERLQQPPNESAMKRKIDSALTKYSASLQKSITTVECAEAKAFATGIFEHCQRELLRPDLSEGKKYYNLRTKQITAEALEQLGDCQD